jgi:hypothetical protein
LGLVVSGSLLAAAVALASPPASPPVSKFAPIDDLAGQIEQYVKDIDTALANPAEYDEVKQARVRKQAHTLCVLAMSLGLHDEDHPLKAAAASVIQASQNLAGSADKADAAVSARDALKAALAGGGSPGELEWKRVAAQGQLMKQVTTLNARLKRSTMPARFQRMSKEAAGDAAVLAAIAQSLLYDTHEVKNEAELPQWYELAAQFRETAAALNLACRAGDQAQAAALIKRLNQNCHSCHTVFRQDLLNQPEAAE